MAKTIKDTDYLVISARVKALETGLLTAERMEQILDAKSGEDAGKLLQEWGYPQLDPRRPEAMDAALSAVREATLADLAEGTPDARYIDLFKVKYDYHNVKALLKAEAVGTAPDRMLMDMGRVSTAELAEAVRSRELDGLPETLAAAVVEAPGGAGHHPRSPAQRHRAGPVVLPGYGGPGRGDRQRVPPGLCGGAG